MFNFKKKITDKPGGNRTKDVETMVPLKYLSNFWRNLEIPIIDFKSKLILTWSGNFVISSCTATSLVTTLAITDTKLYALAVNQW